MAELLSEIEYGRILGSFTAVQEDSGDTVAPDAIPLSGTVVFTPTHDHISYINSAGETASLYLDKVVASVVNGRLVGRDGQDGVVLLASNSNNVSASVLWRAVISIDPIGPSLEAPELHTFLIEVRRNEISSLIDVIKANSRVHNIALFNDAIAEAAEEFWRRVDSGEFRGNQGPPGPSGGPGVGVAGPVGVPGRVGVDGAPGLGGNMIPDGDLEYSGFFVSGDYQQSSDAVSGDKSVTLTNATSRKIAIDPDSSYLGGAYFKSDVTTSVLVSLRVFGLEGDISRVIENSYNVVGGEWRKCSFALDGVVGDQSLEIIVKTDGRTVLADHFTLTNSTVIRGLEQDLTEAKAQLDQAMADLDKDLEYVDSERIRLNESLNDLAVVLESADVDLTEVNNQLEDLRNDLEAEETKRQDADAAAQLIIEALNSKLAQAQIDLADNKTIMDNLGTDLEASEAELATVKQNIETLETVTLPELQQTLQDAADAAVVELGLLDDKLYGADGDITTAKNNITQLATDLAIEAEAREQLALQTAADFSERDDRLSQAESVLDIAFPDGAFDVSQTIKESVVQYAVSSSDSVPPTTGWSTTSPTRTPGQFIWFRSVVTYVDGTTNTSSAAVLTGNTGAEGPPGEPGEDGADGKGVSILGSLDSEDDLPTTGNAGDAYLVAGYLYVWGSGGWTNVGLIRGPQGVQGPAGEDGAPRYTWVKYGTSASGAGMSDDPAGKTYVGLAYNQTSATESSVATDYQWALIQGPKGDVGGKGDTGVGISSVTPYYRDTARGAAAPGVPTTMTPSGWSTTEPAWAPNRDLYRVERIVYTNSTFAYTAVVKIAAYAGIDAAMAAANGKNLNTYTDLAPASKPGPAPAPNSARTVGDIHRNRDATTGEIWAEYQWTGSVWKAVKFGDSVLTSLDVGKITGGTGSFQQFFADKLIADNATINKLWTDQLVGKTASFNRLNVSPQNLIPDPQGLDAEITAHRTLYSPDWAMSSAGYWRKTTNIAGNNQIRLESSLDTIYKTAPITPGQRYVLSYEVYLDSGNADCRFAVRYTNLDGSTNYIGDEVEAGGDDDIYTIVSGGEWIKVVRYWDAPATAVSASFDIQVNNVRNGASDIRARNPLVLPSVGGVLIENGAVNADKINAESVGAAVGSFIELETSQLIATDSITTPAAVIEKLWADGIAARSITASRLAISPSNLFPDPFFQEKDKWEVSDDRIKVIYGDTPQDNYLRVSTRDRQTGSYFGSSSDRPARVEANAEYRLRMKVRFISPSGATARFGMATRMDQPGGSSGTVGDYVTLTPSDSWVDYETSISALGDATGPANFGLFDSSPYTEGNTIEVKDVVITRMVGSVLIEDGAVNASKINAESVAAAVGQFITVEAGNIVAGSANIDSLVAQKIAAATATFQKVNAGNIVSSTATIDSAVINQIWADGIAAKAITTNKLVVATENMVPDSQGLDPELRSQLGGASWTWNDTGKYWRRPAVTGGTTQFNAFIPATGLTASFYEVMPLQPGINYSITYEVWVDAVTSSTGARASIYYKKKDGTTSYVGDGYGTGDDDSDPSDSVSAGVWVPVSRSWKAPDDAVSGGVGLQLLSTASNATEVRIRNPRIVPKVGAVVIENGAVSADHLTSNSVDTRHLRADAITTDKIGANQVVTAHMVANSIDGDRIRVNTLDAGKIAANTITADKIAARTISAAEIKTRTILAENIVASTITANEIKARTITAVEIKAGAITANELDVNNITANSGIINNLWTNGLSAKAITTSRLSVAYDNLIPNGNGELGDLTYWPYWAFSAGAPGQTGAVNGFRSASSSFMPIAEGENIPLIAGKEYLMDVWIDSSRSGMDTAIQVNHQTASGTSISAEYPIWPKGMSAGLNYYTGTFTPPADTGRGYFRIVPVHSNGNAGTNTFYNFRVRPKTGGTLIENGAITTDLIKANAVTAVQLAANSVTASKIKAGSVETNSMTANAINGNRIAAGTIVAEKITSGSFEGKAFTGGEFIGSVIIGASIATTRYASRDGGVHIGENTGLRAWDTNGLQTIGINGTSNFLSGTISTARSGQPGTILTPVVPESGGGTGIWFSQDGSRSGAQAAIYSKLDGNIYIRPKVSTPSGTIFIDGNLVVNNKTVFAGNVEAGGFIAPAGVVNAGTLRISGNGAVDANFYADTITVYHPGTSTGSANARITGGGLITIATSSSRRYKEQIEDYAPDVEGVLALQPRSWAPKDEDPDLTLTANGRYVGFIAEEVHDLGLTDLVVYNEDEYGTPRPDGLNYDRFAAAQQVVLVDHDARIKELEEQVALLLSRLDS